MKNTPVKFISLLLLLIFFVISNHGFAVIPNNVQQNNATEKVSPVEDLMREHGALTRLLLIYEEIIKRLDHNEAAPTKELTQATEIIRNFIQNYHEKLEEKYVFVKFNSDKKLRQLTNTLIKQHQAGRKIIDKILANEIPQNAEEKKQLANTMRSFIKMYRPHKGREDTILFPAFHAITSDKEYNQLGEIFEDEEHHLFGEHGFETILSKIEGIEKSLGIYKLSQFTPKNF